MKYWLKTDGMLTVVNDISSFNQMFEAGAEFERCCFVHKGVIFRQGGLYVYVASNRLAELFNEERQKLMRPDAPWRFNDEPERNDS